MAAVKRCSATQDQISAAGGPPTHARPRAEIGTATAEAFIGDNPTRSSSAGRSSTTRAARWSSSTSATCPPTTSRSTIKANAVTFDLGNAESLERPSPPRSTLKIDNAGTKTKPWLRTPKTCPKGKWAASEPDTYTGGVTAAAKTTVPCKKTER